MSKQTFGGKVSISSYTQGVVCEFIEISENNLTVRADAQPVEIGAILYLRKRNEWKKIPLELNLDKVKNLGDDLWSLPFKPQGIDKLTYQQLLHTNYYSRSGAGKKSAA